MQGNAIYVTNIFHVCIFYTTTVADNKIFVYFFEKYNNFIAIGAKILLK